MSDSPRRVTSPSPVFMTVFAALTLFGVLSCQQSPPTNKSTSDQQESGQENAADRTYQSRLEKAEENLAKQEEAKEKKVNTLYQKAQTLFKKGEYDRALEETKNALELDPTHEKAEQLKQTILSLQGERSTASGKMEDLENRLEAKIEQEQVQIEADLEQAKNLMKNEEYGKAKKKLESIKTRLKAASWMDSKTFDRYKKEVSKLLEEATTKSQKRQELIQKKLQEEAREKAIKEQQKQRMEEIRWTDRLMEQAILHFKQEEYQRTIELTDTILSRFPNFQAAKDLQKDAEKAYAGEWKEQHRREKAEEWKNFQERMMAKRIPQTKNLKFPDPEYWKKVNQRSSQREPISTTKDEEVQQQLFSLRKKLKSESTNLEFAGTDLYNVLDVLREKHDLNIVLDSKAKEKARKERSIVLKDLRLGNALSLVTQKFGLRYDLREAMVFITTPAQVRPQTQLQTFKTRDLVYLLNDVKDFESDKQIGLQKSSENLDNTIRNLNVAYSGSESKNKEGYPPYSEDDSGKQKQDQKKKPKGKQVNLASMVKEHVATDTWKHDNTGIQQAYNGMLFVRNTPEVLAEVERFVDDLRSFAGSMVHVRVRFLVLRDEFLEHFGVEFKNADDGSQTISPANQDDLPAGVFGQQGTTSAPGPGVDYLFHSNFGTRTNPPTSTLASLTNTGGLGLTYEVLAGTDYQMVLRALQKDDKSYVLDSTHFTLFNTQRANINIGTQKAFLQDVDVQPAAGTTAFDPVIGVVGTGLVLDVRPIISFDRRYVTLQLLPSITTDVSFRPFDILDFGTDIPPLSLQLPQVEVKKVSTTVRLPDKGGLLLGGLTRSETISKTEGVPVLQDIPVLGSLFKETVDRELGRELRILVNVEIVNTSERQQEAYGSSSTTNIQGNQQKN